MELLFLLMVLMSFINVASGRARLVEPPMRSSIWRYDIYNVPENLMDEYLNCGGFEYQWAVADGNCGTCGDPYYGPANNIYPGLYANNVLTRTVTQGSFLNVSVFAEKNLMGYFKFSLCPEMNVEEYVDLDLCFHHYPLKIFDTNSTTYYVGSGGGLFNMMLVLPPDVVCKQCVLQWVYVTGYREGRDKYSCRDCLGCGPQETYINCADFTIEPYVETKLNFDTFLPTPSNRTKLPTTTESNTNGITTTSPTTVGSANMISNNEVQADKPAERGSILLINGTISGDRANSTNTSDQTPGSNSLVINLSTLIENGATLASPSSGDPNKIVNTNNQDVETTTESNVKTDNTTFGTPTPTSTLPTDPQSTTNVTTLADSTNILKQSFPVIPGKPQQENVLTKDAPSSNPFIGTMPPPILLPTTNQSEIQTQVHKNIQSNPRNNIISAVRINIKEEICFSNSTYLKCESKTKPVSWCLEECYINSCPEEFCSCYCLMVNGEKYPLSPQPVNVVQRLSTFSDKSRPQRLCYLPRPQWRFATALGVWCKTNCPGIRCYSLCLPQAC